MALSCFSDIAPLFLFVCEHSGVDGFMFKALNKAKVSSLDFLILSMYLTFKPGSVSHFLLARREKNRAPRSTPSCVCSVSEIVPVGISNHENDTGDGVLTSLHVPAKIIGVPDDVVIVETPVAPGSNVVIVTGTAGIVFVDAIAVGEVAFPDG